MLEGFANLRRNHIEERAQTSKGAGPLAEGLLSSLPASVQPGFSKQLQLQEALLFNNLEADVQFNFGATGMKPNAGNDVFQSFEHNDVGGFAGITTVLTHAFSRGAHYTSEGQF
ncbi:hypothetical protein VTL71DRAFT_11760 [Oculimacula yallundae]|uniref:Uncharacterized protein n=1 Tax=Oculimacula yallundae TaxID=86028 RepID=A0ABR4CRN7_9HELO